MSKMRIVGIVLLGSLVSCAVAFTQTELLKAGYEPKGTVIPELGDEHSTHYSNGDGTIRAEIDGVVPERLPTAEGSFALESMPCVYSGFSELLYYYGSLFYSVKHTTPVRGAFFCGYYGDLYPDGWILERGWVEWNVASIPTGSTVNGVACRTYRTELTGSYPTVRLYQMTYRPNSPATAEQLYSDAGDGSMYGENVTVAGWNSATLNAAARTDLQSHLADDWFAIGYTGTGPTSGYVTWEIGLAHHTSANPPRLVVDYTPPGSVDIQSTAIVQPTGTVNWNTSLDPQATFKNNSTTAQTFNVWFRIGTAYASGPKQVTNLGPGSSYTMAFDNWTATDTGAFAAKCSAYVAGDINRQNDTLIRSVWVQKKDAEAVQILAPTTTIPWGSTVTPRLQVRNNSSFASVCSARFYVPGGGFDDTAQTASTVLPGATGEITFRDWTANTPGTFWMRCTTRLQGDQVRVNDTIKAQIEVRKTDAEVLSIDAPGANVTWGTSLQPKATVRNNGSTQQTFNVLFVIADGSNYSRLEPVTLGPGAQTQVSFPSWTANFPGGPFNLRCTTQLSLDQVEGNNLETGQVTVDASAPTLLSPADGDTTNDATPTFTWSSMGGSFAYRIQLDEDPLFGSPLDAWPATNSWTPGSDLDDITWYWRVCGVLAGNSGPFSAGWDVTIDVTPPAMPVLVSPAEDTTQNYLPLFDWNPIADARQFNLAVYDNGHVPAPGFPVNVVQAPGEDKSYYQLTLDAPLADGKYTWAVEALDYATNSSGFCAEQWFAVDRTPPAVPVLVSPIGGVTVNTALPRLDWQPVADARRFELEVYGPGHSLLPWCPKVISQAEGENKSEYQLEPGEELSDLADYTWRVRAVDYATNASEFCTEEGFRVQLPQHDVAVMAVLAPAGQVPENTVVFPVVRVHNAGGVVETFPLRVVIDDLGDAEVFNFAEQVTGLAIGETREFAFIGHSWTATPRQEYSVTAISELGNDQYRHNDTVRQGFEVVMAEPWPSGWHEVEPLSILPSSKAVKDGGAIVVAPAGRDKDPKVFAAKGNKTSDFYQFDPFAGTRGRWSIRESVPPAEAGALKRPSKGCAATSDGQCIYLTKGNSTFGFWRYAIAGDSWARLPDVPEGPDAKKVKGGTDLAYVLENDTGYVYLLKGYKTEFYRFNTRTGRWDTLDNVPYGAGKAKYDKGSFLVYDGDSALYAHQAKFNDGANHFMFRYSLRAQAWRSLPLRGMPVLGLYNGTLKRKKSKDGAAGAWYDGGLYALKGGNTQNFYRYSPAGDSWTELDTMPAYGSTAKKKRVKAGGDLVYYGMGAFFAFKGNKTLETWRYVQPTGAQAQAQAQARTGVMAGPSTIYDLRMTISPNPMANGFATLRYSLPRPGPVSVSVYDALGRSVLHHFITPSLHHSVSLDLRTLSAGVYLVRLDAGGSGSSQKFVIQR